jgi:hypothetical protein
MNLKRTAAALIVTATALAGTATLAPSAQASGGNPGVARSGSCSGTSNWNLKAKPDDGRIQVEFEVDSNRNGQNWAVAIRDNGNLVFSGNRTTHAPSGSFTVERRVANRAGADHFVARATNANTGESCVGRVTL